MLESTKLEVVILKAFEQIWDEKVAELADQREKNKEYKEKGEKNPKLPLIDFSKLNMLAVQILRMRNAKTDEEISVIFKNMLSEGRTVEDHKRYFEYAQCLARFIEQDTSTRIADIIAGNKN